MNLLTISPSTFYKDSLFFLAVVEIGFSMLATIETSSCAARKKKKKKTHIKLANSNDWEHFFLTYRPSLECLGYIRELVAELTYLRPNRRNIQMAQRWPTSCS
jgi:hypothetical protein